jgi:hypothetical protein
MKEQMVSLDKSLRPDCQQILKDETEWYLSLNDLRDDKEFKLIVGKRIGTHSIDESFHRYFIQQKTEFLFKSLTSVKRVLNDKYVNEFWQMWN